MVPIGLAGIPVGGEVGAITEAEAEVSVTVFWVVEVVDLVMSVAVRNL